MLIDVILLHGSFIKRFLKSYFTFLFYYFKKFRQSYSDKIELLCEFKL